MLSPGIDERVVDFACDVHGNVKDRQIKLSTTSGWGKPRCEQCLKEKCEQEEKESLEREERDRIASRKANIASMLRGSEIPERFRARTFENYLAETDKATAALNQCQDYAKDFQERKKRGQCIIMCGTTGTGKTHLACSIAHHIISNFALSAVYMTASRAFRMVKDTYRRESEKTEQEAIRFFAQPDLLILDEIGIQYGSDTEKNILFDIINERYENLLPTILISNLNLDGLSGYVGDRVLDRMKENGGKLMIFDWKSHRSITA